MELTTRHSTPNSALQLFMITKIQNLNGTHNSGILTAIPDALFMITKIQNLNGTHNHFDEFVCVLDVVYDVKDTKFEWNSQL